MLASSFKRKKYILGSVILIAAIAIAAWIVFFILQERARDTILALPDIAAPSGWYAHTTNEMGPSFLIFTRNSVLPTIGATEGYAYGEQIDVDVATTTLSPEAFIAHQGYFNDPAGKVFDSNWSTLGGRPLFAIRGEDAEGADFKAEFLFASDMVYNFNLYPDDAKDYGDLQKIIREVSGELR
jgi:hypothetical protein